MSNPLNNGQVQQQPDMKALFEKFKQNPMQYLGGLNIPSNITTPKQAVEYCVSIGKVPPILQQQINAMLGKK